MQFPALPHFYILPRADTAVVLARPAINFSAIHAIVARNFIILLLWPPAEAN